MLQKFFRAAIIGAGAIALSGTAHAIETITASPSAVDLNLAAGEERQGTVKIINTGTDAFSFTSFASPYSVSGEDYEQSFIIRPDVVDASKWITSDPVPRTLVPGKTHLLTYRVRVPAEASPGGHYAVLFSETDTPSTGTIRAKKRVGIVFYMTVKGQLDERGKVESFVVRGFQGSAPLETMLRMRNDGNVHYTANVEARVKDLFGNTKTLMPAEKLIMPKSIRRIPLNWEKVPGFGLFRVEGNVKYLGKTETLPSHLVLVVSAQAFLVLAAIITALGLYAYFTRRNVRRGR